MPLQLIVWNVQHGSAAYIKTPHGKQRYSIQSPFVSNLPPAWSTLPPPITVRPSGGPPQ